MSAHETYIASLADEKTRLQEQLAHLGRSAAMLDVARERSRQVDKEGWSADHDDEHAEGELAQAAAVYAWPHKIEVDGKLVYSPDIWPWWDNTDISGGRGETPVWQAVKAWFKPTDRRRDLVKAAALIVAEIERLDRAKGDGRTPAPAEREGTSK
jgi:hypothetical protein